MVGALKQLNETTDVCNFPDILAPCDQRVRPDTPRTLQFGRVTVTVLLQVVERNGRPVRARTADLHRVKVAL
jgi:hypothetical protein